MLLAIKISYASSHEEVLYFPTVHCNPPKNPNCPSSRGSSVCSDFYAWNQASVIRQKGDCTENKACAIVPPAPWIVSQQNVMKLSRNKVFPTSHNFLNIIFMKMIYLHRMSLSYFLDRRLMLFQAKSSNIF